MRLALRGCEFFGRGPKILSLSGHLGRLPMGHHAMKLSGRLRLVHAGSQFGVTEHFSDLRQNFQVFLGSGLGHQQKNKQLHGLGVRRVKTYWVGQLEYRRHGVFEAFDTQIGRASCRERV